MALYQNGILVSGANQLPQMTMAEYLAIPASDRPTYWICTDRDYDDLSADHVTYDSGSVADALDNKVSKSGDTMSGNLTVDRQNGTTSTVGYGLISVGNILPEGTEKNTQGFIDVFGSLQYRSRIKAGVLTGHRDVELPDKSGTIAITDDIYKYINLINSSDDLDDILAPGHYTFAAASLPINRPADAATVNGYLIVEYYSGGGATYTQTYVCSSSGILYTWKRRYWSGAWGNWQRFAFTSELITEEDIDLSSYMSTDWSIEGNNGFLKAHKIGNMVVINGISIKCNSAPSYLATNIPDRIKPSKDIYAVATNDTDKNRDYNIYILSNGNMAIANIGFVQWAKVNCIYSFSICYATSM